jgi:HCOMODA/2-hydroxy-3-carboxy-muconic semialdehyde decarboxylase
MSPEATVAIANRILFHQGILDAFGHVSARDPADTELFLLSRNLAPAMVGEADILRFDLEGTPLCADSPAVYLERFIHAAIYRRRPDVGAIVHSHVASVLPYGLVPEAKLCPVCHMAGFIRRNTPVFEIRHHRGMDSNLLIDCLELGCHLADCLDGHPLVLMRGHGMTVVGDSIQEAVFRAVYTEINARTQAAARPLGDPIFLSEMEAQAADAANRGQIQRAWNFWSLQASIER